MDQVTWVTNPPQLRNPAALIAFSGWGDAGESSTDALEPLLRQDTVEVATIDPDDFYDFQMRRPTVRSEANGRVVEWPGVDFVVISLEERDVVVVRGEEPNFAWKKLGELVASVLSALNVVEVLTMGAYVGHVVHTLPVPVVASAFDKQTILRTGLVPSEYEGPSGIIGVLSSMLADKGFEVVSVWAAVPHYLSSQPYLPGAVALGEKAAELLRFNWDDSDFRAAAASYRHAIDLMVDEDDDLAEYVRRVEADLAEESSSSNLVAEIERYLNEH